MKTCRKALILPILLFISLTAFSQTNNDPKTLVDDGVALFDKGDYNGAMEKYKAALAINPNDYRADFELAYTLYTTGKGQDAIPYLQLILKSGESKYETYELLGSIYDDSNQSDKAVEAYKAGIKEKPDFERLHFNLGITYLRLKRYPEAETEGIEALKLNPTHASAHRLYALAAQDQGKRAIALLAWCNFLLLEPQTKRSTEAFSNVEYIINRGIKKNNEKSISISISSSDTDAYNLTMPMAVMASTLDKKDLKPVDSLNLQLTTVMQILGEQTASKGDFFSTYYARYFAKLAKSDNMPAFTHYITLSAWKDEDIAWFNSHNKELKDMQQWLKDNVNRGY
jgi:tetratricopeptide (TPR) repeat protein